MPSGSEKKKVYLIILSLDREERFRMSTYRAFFRRFYRFSYISAVSAHPQFFLIPFEQFLIFYVGQQQPVLFFVPFFNFRYPFRKAISSKPSSLAVLANSGYMEVHSSFSPSAAIFRCSAVGLEKSPSSQNQILA